MTNFTDIFGRFSIKIQDYALDKLFQQSESAYNNYIKGFLLNAIPKFTECKSSLSDRDDANMKFNSTLSELEQEILACMMVIEWCEREEKNILDIRLGLNDDEFKRYAEANNLREKRALKIENKEAVDKLIVSYGYATIDFDKLYG